MGANMADIKQLEILKQGVEVWNKWRDDNPEVEIDLSHAILMYAHLQGINLREAGLWKVTFYGAHLRGADFQRAELREANFWQADLLDADLTGAKLDEANLARAFLMGANLSEADLRGANFGDAVLNRANLSGADLSGASFDGAYLNQTVFTKAVINYTSMRDTDLSESVGLESIHSIGPSRIDFDTIRNSKGKIPVAFLRGSGLSDLDIEYAKLAAPGLDPDQVAQVTYEIHRMYCDQPIQFYSCFISYNSKDQKFAQQLHDDLQNNGVRCWFAPEDLKIGDEFRRTIGQQIRFRDKLLIILSKNSIGSEWVGDEVEKALAEEKEQKGLKLFPIRLDGAVLKTKDDWAEKIRLRRHIGDFSAWKDEAKYKKAFERLLKDLKAQ